MCTAGCSHPHPMSALPSLCNPTQPRVPLLPFSSCLFLLILGGFLELVLEGAGQLIEQPHLLAVLQEPGRRRGLICWGGITTTSIHTVPPGPLLHPLLTTKPDVVFPSRPFQPVALSALRGEWGRWPWKEQIPKAQRDQGRRSNPPASTHLHATLQHKGGPWDSSL